MITAYIGSGIQKIESKAFANCTSLNDVYFLAYRYPTTDANANKTHFSNINNMVFLHFSNLLLIENFIFPRFEGGVFGDLRIAAIIIVIFIYLPFLFYRNGDL